MTTKFIPKKKIRNKNKINSDIGSIYTLLTQALDKLELVTCKNKEHIKGIELIKLALLYIKQNQLTRIGIVFDQLEKLEIHL